MTGEDTIIALTEAEAIEIIVVLQNRIQDAEGRLKFWSETGDPENEAHTICRDMASSSRERCRSILAKFDADRERRNTKGD